MTATLVGCALLTLIAVWVAVFALRRWLHAMGLLVRWQEQWDRAPEMCSVCLAPFGAPCHVPADMEARSAEGHRFGPARLVSQSPGLLLPTGRGER